MRRTFIWLPILTLLITGFRIDAQIGANERDMASGMLDAMKGEIKKNYYDPTFHGVDLDYVWEQAKEQIKTAPSRDALMMTLASAVMSLDDSHTTFFAPARAADFEYGWRADIIGDGCYITGVKPKSDAEAKGLKVGDRVLTIDGVRPTRGRLWRTYYRLYAVMPMAKVTFSVLSPADEKPHTLEIQTKISKTKTLLEWEDIWAKIVRRGWDISEKDKYYEFGNDLLIWQMSSFGMSDYGVDTMMSKAKNHKSLILDLRNNGGGRVDTLKRLMGYFFDKEITFAQEKKRKETKPMVAKSRGNDGFKGNLIVLINHGSGSASEVFARIIQMEKRGKVIGDRSAGAVMESRFYNMEIGVGSVLFYGLSITIADILMPDGKSLEKTGVTPDETMLPTGKDLSLSRDPVLAHAAKLCGVEVTPEKAGTFFPIKWDR